MQNCQEQTQKTQNIIILHGWGSSSEKWLMVQQKVKQISGGPSSADLAEARPPHFIIPDLPGFKKETALSRAWNLDDYVDWFSRHCEGTNRSERPKQSQSADEARPRPCTVLIGHSFGGRMAIKFAAQNPEKLKALILVSSAGIKQIRGGRASTKLGEGGPPQIFAVARIGKKFSFLWFYPVFRRFFYRYILRKTDYINAEKFPFLQETFKNIIAEDLTPYLEKIKTPTLIIWGNKDKMTPVSDAYLMNKKIPNSKLEILENIGHAPHLECPEFLAEKIHKFISMSF